MVKGHTNGGNRFSFNLPVILFIVIIIFMVNFFAIMLYQHHGRLRSTPIHAPKFREKPRKGHHDAGKIWFHGPVKYKEFKQHITTQEIKQLLNIIDKFSGALRKAKIPYFMYKGTLLGSWRHHGHIPWANNVDFAIPLGHKKKAMEYLATLKPAYLLNTQHKRRWKFYSAHGRKVKGAKWHFPYVDINFYDHNKTHIWDADRHFKRFVFPKTIVYPLTLRPYQGHWFPAPKDAKTVLSLTYKIDNCTASRWIFRKKRHFHKQRSVKCTELHNNYGFVNRLPVAKTGCNETLVLGGQVVHWIFLEREKC